MFWPREAVQVFRAVAPVGDQVLDGQVLGRAVLLRRQDGAVLAVVAEPGGARSREGVVAGGGVGLARVAQVAAVACRVGHHTESEQCVCRQGRKYEQGNCGLHFLCRVGHHTESEQCVCRQGRKYEQGNCGLHSLCPVGHHSESEQGKCGLHSLCPVGHHTKNEQCVCRQGQKYEQCD